MSRENFLPGDKVRIIRTESCQKLTGQWGIVDDRQNVSGKIRVRIGEHVEAFPPDNLDPARKLRDALFGLIRRREFLYEELRDTQCRINRVDQIIKKFARKNHLCRKCGSVMERRPDLDGFLLEIWKCTGRDCGDIDIGPKEEK